MTIDGTSIERFQHQIEAEWRDPRVTAGYRKWDCDLDRTNYIVDTSSTFLPCTARLPTETR